MKINKTFLGVIAFVIVLILAGYSAKSDAEQRFHLGVGKTVINSQLKIGELGFEINNWEFQAGLLEQGPTKNGNQKQLEVFSVSYLTKPDWGYKGVDPYLRFGASYNNGSNLVGPSNFKLGLGFNFHKVFRLEYVHHSSAGIHQTNTGIDYVMLNYQVPVFWNK